MGCASGVLHPTTGECYQLFPDQVTQAEAKQRLESRDMTLLSIRSQAELDWVRDTFGGVTGWDEVWLGAEERAEPWFWTG